MDTAEILDRLVMAAGLAPVASTGPVDGHGYGLDNALTRAVLSDGREVLLRISRVQQTSPRVRADLLAAWRVGAPRLYAADDSGATLVEFIPGRRLADLVADDADNDRMWELTGAAFARTHAVRFPAPLQGTVGPTSIELAPVDPVNQLQTSLDTSQLWLTKHRPQVLPALDHLHQFVESRAAEIRSEGPCLVHGDANLLNIIVGDEAVTLIDWDFPAIRYPLAELSALDEHVYLNGGTGLPVPFFTGYGRKPPADLLLTYRMDGCLGWLRGDDWAHWDSNTTMPAPARQRLARWHHQLLKWLDHMPQLINDLRI